MEILSKKRGTYYMKIMKEITEASLEGYLLLSSAPPPPPHTRTHTHTYTHTRTRAHTYTHAH